MNKSVRRAGKPKKKEEEMEPDDQMTDKEEEPDLDDFTSKLDIALQSQSIRKSFGVIFAEHVDTKLKPLISEEVTRQVNSVSDRLEGLQMATETKFNINDKDIKAVTKSTAELNDRVLSMERANKSRNLIFVGLPPLPPAPHVFPDTQNHAPQDEAAAAIPTTIDHPEYEKRLIAHVCGQLSRANIKDVSPSQIASATTIKVPGQQNRILLKFISEKQKINVFKQKKLLKDLPYKAFINEDLTKSDGQIFKKTRQDVKSGILFATWTKGGIVHAKASKEGEPFVVSK